MRAAFLQLMRDLSLFLSTVLILTIFLSPRSFYNFKKSYADVIDGNVTQQTCDRNGIIGVTVVLLDLLTF